ncbi:GtrA family protein [Pseudomonas sp. FSL W5-0299]|uniref:GtrA family protein n=1 Tax=Pseudomonas sp. FSL W5-0299 TaxID=1917484 RepID=UPI00098B66D2|nr:hypothetical protein BOO94_08225 [Pseudomonas sp. FSL W5-0299]
MNYLSSPAIGQFIRYGAVGLANNLMLYLGYLLVVYSGVGEKSAMTLMYMIGVAISFIANYKWTFSQKTNRGALVRYIQMHVAGYLINFAMLFVLVDIFHHPHELIQVLAIITVAFFGFFMCKFYVFRPSSI